MKNVVVRLVPGHALGERLIGEGITVHHEGDKKFVWAHEIASIFEYEPEREPEPEPETKDEPKPKAEKKKAKKGVW